MKFRLKIILTFAPFGQRRFSVVLVTSGATKNYIIWQDVFRTINTDALNSFKFAPLTLSLSPVGRGRGEGGVCVNKANILTGVCGIAPKAPANSVRWRQGPDRP